MYVATKEARKYFFNIFFSTNQFLDFVGKCELSLKTLIVQARSKSPTSDIHLCNPTSYLGLIGFPNMEFWDYIPALPEHFHISEAAEWQPLELQFAAQHCLPPVAEDKGIFVICQTWLSHLIITTFQQLTPFLSLWSVHYNIALIKQSCYLNRNYLFFIFKCTQLLVECSPFIKMLSS